MWSIQLANDGVKSAINVMTGTAVTGNLANESSKVTNGGVARPLTFDMDNNFRENVKNAFELSFFANLNGKEGDGGGGEFNSKTSSITKRIQENYYLSDDLIIVPREVTWTFKNAYSKTVGEFTMSCPDTAIFEDKLSTCASREAKFDEMIARTDDLAYKFIQDLFEHPEKFGSNYVEACANKNNEMIGYYACMNYKLNNIGTDLISGVGETVSSMINSKDAESGAWGTEVRAIKENIQAGGFLLLGSYYMRMNNLNNLINEALKTKTRYTINRESALKSVASNVSFSDGDSAASVGALDLVIRNAPFSTNAEMLDRIEGSESQSEVEGYLTKAFGSQLLGAKAATFAIGGILGGNEPISHLQTLGLTMIAGVDTFLTTWAAYTAGKQLTVKLANGVSDAASNIPFVGWAFGAIGKVAAKNVEAINFYIQSYMEIFKVFVDPLITAMVAALFFITYYLPALPAIMWVLAVMGWVILVIESVVAAPIWAAAHAIPEGEGIAGQHGRQGYLMMINILLRPSLMVIGFFLAMALITAFSTFSIYVMQNALLSNVRQGTDNLLIGILSFGGPFGFVMSFLSSLIIIGGVLTMVIHKSLGLITWLPENVIKWIGGQGTSLGEQSDERRVATMVGALSARTNLGHKVGGKPTPGGSGDKGGKPDGEDGGNGGQPGGGGSNNGGRQGKDESKAEMSTDITIKR